MYLISLSVNGAIRQRTGPRPNRISGGRPNTPPAARWLTSITPATEKVRLQVRGALGCHAVRCVRRKRPEFLNRREQSPGAQAALPPPPWGRELFALHGKTIEYTVVGRRLIEAAVNPTRGRAIGSGCCTPSYSGAQRLTHAAAPPRARAWHRVWTRRRPRPRRTCATSVARVIVTTPLSFRRASSPSRVPASKPRVEERWARSGGIW